MKNTAILFIILAVVIFYRCGKEEETGRFGLLTGHLWTSDSLLVNGLGAGEPGQLLYKFKGDAKFNSDGTGTFGKYSGKWWFTESQAQVVISSDSLLVPLTTKIVELTEKSFKITTSVPDVTNLSSELKIRMTFKSK